MVLRWRNCQSKRLKSLKLWVRSSHRTNDTYAKRVDTLPKVEGTPVSSHCQTCQPERVKNLEIFFSSDKKSGDFTKSSENELIWLYLTFTVRLWIQQEKLLNKNFIDAMLNLNRAMWCIIYVIFALACKKLSKTNCTFWPETNVFFRNFWLNF
jgi:hypothetical protein